ncbi:MAG TPA: cupin domain-containing protein [Gemmatimonadaceae bacterium]
MSAGRLFTAIAFWGLTTGIIATAPAVIAAQVPGTSPDRSATNAAAPMFVKYRAVRWERIFPKLGARSPEISILHVDPSSHATQLLLRVPRDFHVSKHWHSANETHTIVSGTFVMDSAGKRVELGPGSFNFMPAKMVHEAWTKPNEGTVLFITVDGAWDVNFVEGPPTGEFVSKHR